MKISVRLFRTPLPQGSDPQTVADCARAVPMQRDGKRSEYARAVACRIEGFDGVEIRIFKRAFAAEAKEQSLVHGKGACAARRGHGRRRARAIGLKIVYVVQRNVVRGRAHAAAEDANPALEDRNAGVVPRARERSGRRPLSRTDVVDIVLGQTAIHAPAANRMNPVSDTCQRQRPPQTRQWR